MAKAGTVAVRFTGDTRDFEQAVNRVEGKTGGLGKAFLGVGAAIGGAFAVSKITDFVGGSIEAFGEAEKVSKQTEAALKSTGNAAGVTAEHVGTLAHSLQNMSGMSDESIQSGQNLLLTFTNLKNGVGKGNDIFDQTSQIMVDMAARMGTDASGSAIQLGKALNDPVKGITALTRVGVSFTDQQKEQIKALVASGDTMGAQKIILAELNKEFGGSAKAMGDAMTPIEKLKLRFGDFQEMVGSKVVPIVEKLAVWLGQKLPPIFSAISQFLTPIIADLKSFFYTLTSGFTEDEGTPIEFFALMLRDTFLPVIQKISAFVKDNLKPILIGLGVAVLAFVVPPFVAWAAATIIALAPIVAIGAAVAALVAGVIYAYEHFEAFRTVVDGVASFLTDTVWPAIQAFTQYIIGAFGALVDWVKQYWPQISEAVQHVMSVINWYINFYLGLIKAVWHAVGDDILNYLGAVFDAYKVIVETAIKVIRDIIAFVLALINGDWGKAWDALKQIVVDVWDGIVGLAKAWLEAMQAVLGGLASLLADLFHKAWDALYAVVDAAFARIRESLSSGISDILGFFTGLPGKIVDAVGDLGSRLYNLGKRIVEEIIKGIKKSAGGVGDAILNAIPGVGAVNTVVDLFKSSAGLRGTAPALINGELVTQPGAGNSPALRANLDALRPIYVTVNVPTDNPAMVKQAAEAGTKAALRARIRAA